MAKLNQIIAVEKGIKSRVYGQLTDLNKVVQKPDLFLGFSKTYQKKDDEAEDLPAEKKRVQVVADDILRHTANALSELMYVTARKDWTNCVAKASVVIDGKTTIEDAPVSFLLFMEKQLTDLRTLVANIPMLDENESWTKDENSGLFKAEPTQTHRTRKIQRPLVLYPATPEHPAQTQIITEDVIAGWWTQIKQSGAMPKPKKTALAGRIEALLIATKEAREAANNHAETPVKDIGESVFGFLLPS